MMRNRLRVVALAILLTTMTGCNSAPNLPFQYSYTSRDTVEVVLNGVTYQIGRDTPPPADLPFQYSFEPDGDVDIVMAGNTYELESPYDIEGSGKKKKKKSRPSSKRASKKK